MSGNDFEKQVQQKMDELHFAPSEAVWPAVEKQIAERKKRRALFIWLPFLLFLLGGAAWLYNTGTKEITARKGFPVTAGNNKAAGTTTASGQQPTKMVTTARDSLHQHAAIAGASSLVVSDNKKNSGTSKHIDKVADETALHGNDHLAALAANNKNAPAVKHDIRNRGLTSQVGTAGPATINSANKYRNNAASTVKDAAHAGRKLKKTAATVSVHKIEASEEPVQHTIAVDEDEATAATTTVQKDGQNKLAEQAAAAHSTAIAEPPAAAASEGDAISVAEKALADSITNTEKTDSALVAGKSKAAAKKSKKMEWGIDISAGASNIAQGFSGVLSATPAYDAAAYSGNLNSTPGNVNTGNNNFGTPSPVRPGFAYSAKLFISHPLAKKLQLRAGIGYSYYSTRIEVGAKIDSNKALVQYSLRNSSASAGSVSDNYTNRFHFVYLPVTLEQQIGGAGHFSINGGLALSCLAGSNALLYNAQQRIYYRDNTQLNKMQLGLLAGFSYRMFAKSFLIETGPQVNYGLSNIFKKELYGSRHLFFAGIHTSIFFHKKKP